MRLVGARSNAHSFSSQPIARCTWPKPMGGIAFVRRERREGNGERGTENGERQGVSGDEAVARQQGKRMDGLGMCFIDSVAWGRLVSIVHMAPWQRAHVLGFLVKH